MMAALVLMSAQTLPAQSTISYASQTFNMSLGPRYPPVTPSSIKVTFYLGNIPTTYTGIVGSIGGAGVPRVLASTLSVFGQTCNSGSNIGAIYLTNGSVSDWNVGMACSFPDGGFLTASSMGPGVDPDSYDLAQYQVGGVMEDGEIQPASGTWAVGLHPSSIQITPSTLPSVINGHQYSTTLTATGGVPPYAFLAFSTLPAGFSLNGGVLSSTGLASLTAGQSYPFVVQVIDSANNVVTPTLTLTVQSSLQITTTSLSSSVSGAAFSTTLAATGGSGAGYTWSIASGSLPGGFSLTPGGVLSTTGTPPAAAQTYTFTVRVTDSAGNNTTQALTLVVQSGIQITPLTPSKATSGQSYSTTFTATGGSGGGYIWSLASGTLPAGFMLTTGGVLSTTGTPAATALTYSFTVKVTDSTGNTATQALTLVVQPGIQITPTTLSKATSGEPYSTTFTATGGSGNGYIWSLASGVLPSGFTLTPAGTLSTTGNPAAAVQTYSFTVKVTDSVSNTATQGLTFVVEASALHITPTTLPKATSGQPYTAAFTATGGSETGYTWSISAGALPSGFTLTPGGVLSSTGTPAATAQPYDFTVNVTDSAANTATQSLTLLVNAGLSIVPATLPNATSGQKYNVVFSATGGSGTGYTWASSALPSGFALNAGGVLSSAGTPAAPAQSYDFTVSVTDSAANTANQSLSLLIQPPLLVATNALPIATAGVAYQADLLATGGSGTGYSWSLSPGSILPVGFSFSATGVLTSTDNPAEPPGTYSIGVAVTDSSRDIASGQLALVVKPFDWHALAVIYATLALASHVARPGCAVLAADPVLIPLIPFCEAFLDFSEGEYESQSEYYQELAVDPPDPNFTVIAVPAAPAMPLPAADPNVSATLTNAANAVFQNGGQTISLIQAIITSVNRASGALQANNAIWQQRQNQMAESYLAQLAVLISRRSRLQAALQNVWLAEGLPQISVSSADIAAYQETLRASGFPLVTLQLFATLGLSAQDVSALTESLVALDPAQSAALGSFPANLSSPPVVAALNSAVQGTAASGSGATCAQVDLIKASFGTRTGSSTYIMQADLNGDGTVDVIDLAIAAKALSVGTICQ